MNAIEYECSRVVAAFGVSEWKDVSGDWFYNGPIFKGKMPSVNAHLYWGFDRNTDEVCLFEICESIPVYQIPDFIRIETCPDAPDSEGWELANRSEWKTNWTYEFARGLYCLGFEEEEILKQLPFFSAHEKLELRLSVLPKRISDGYIFKK